MSTSSGSSSLTALSDQTPPGSPQAPVATRIAYTPTRCSSLGDTIPPWTKEEEAALILLRLQHQHNFHTLMFPVTPGRVIKHKNLSGVPMSPKKSFREDSDSSGNDADRDSPLILAAPAPLAKMEPALDDDTVERKTMQVPEMPACAPPAHRDTVYFDCTPSP